MADGSSRSNFDPEMLGHLNQNTAPTGSDTCSEAPSEAMRVPKVPKATTQRSTAFKRPRKTPSSDIPPPPEEAGELALFLYTR